MQFTIEEKYLLWKRLNDRWNIKPWNYWYTLSIEETYKGKDLLALDSEFFQREFGTEKMKELLKSTGIYEVIRVSMEGDINMRSEVDINNSFLENRGRDIYWCTLDLGWVIYTTHEGSITFAGTWLVEKIKEKYSNWQYREWS
ncbi:MAG: hypothetical protein Q8936_14745 [Bacillota bacterium]|nr:hypothetical protein [Bacillota bacterium]